MKIDEAIRKLADLPDFGVDPKKWRAAYAAARGKRPVICWPWTNSALRLLAVSNAFHECRSIRRSVVGAGLFRLLKGMTS